MDIIAIAFRIVLWSIEVPRSRALLILDQPFPNCGSLIVRAGAMAKELSKELGMQLIIITHEKKLVQIADRSWEIIHNGTKSIVTRRINRRHKDEN
jgi:ABC-type lipoprotein export system ATPase subunit